MNEEVVVTREFLTSYHPWQRDAWEKINHQHGDKKLSHALLLHGQPQSDLGGFSLLFARYLLCTAPKAELPCGACKDCHLIKAGSHPDFQEITFTFNDEGNLRKIITVDQVRELLEKVQKTAFQGKCKVIVIHPAEAMNLNATNALLKCLEEPPPDTYFILVSYNAGRLLATVRSRCQIVELPLPDLAEADAWLTSLLPDRENRQELLSISGGNPVMVKHWIAEEKDREIITTRIELDSLLMGKTSPLALAQRWNPSKKSQKGESDHLVLERVVWWWRWILVELKQISLQEELHKSFFKLTQKQLIDFMNKLLAAKRQLEGTANPNQTLLLESLLIDWQRLKNT